MTGGVITIDGTMYRELTLESLRKQIRTGTAGCLSVLWNDQENIAYGKPGASMEEIIDARRKQTSMIFIMSLPDGYDTFVGERGTRLSVDRSRGFRLQEYFLRTRRY